MNKETKILCILDGFGLIAKTENNASAQANMPVMRRLLEKYPWMTLDADGVKVGQEQGLVGNSEVGHMNIGGLQLVNQLSYQITRGSFGMFDFDEENPDQLFDPKELLSKRRLEFEKSSIHLITLFSNGTIHSDLRHLIGAIEVADRSGYTNIVLHLFSDGRDSDRESFVPTWNNFTTKFGDRLSKIHSKILLGSVGGRYFGMDRDKNIERTELAIESFFKSKPNTVFIDLDSIAEHLSLKTTEAYKHGIYDETLAPENFGVPIANHDTVWLLNFRSDRMKQLTSTLIDLNKQREMDLYMVAMNSYGIDSEIYNLDNYVNGYIPIFKTQVVHNTLSEYISNKGQNQLHIAETEKYAHVTYFFDGGRKTPLKGEDWIVIDSNKVASHAEKPEMKAKEITDYIIENGLGKYDYIVVNYANPDMVGHTGDMKASITSMEVLDYQLGRLIKEIEIHNYKMIITADHGNIECVGEYTNSEGKKSIDTEHNANPVPLIIVDPNIDFSLLVKKLGASLEKDGIYTSEIFNNTKNISTLSQVVIDGWIVDSQIPKDILPLWYSGEILIYL
ncbi:MAG: phosphoglycerate mutase (2,3-diphosphoglycerate-independent) [candidate division SR1 bacterium]|nr:phosphoglycerate mutase (2,3-diphosphoglycerate-independent) [candidate division SR1 bacterium]